VYVWASTGGTSITVAASTARHSPAKQVYTRLLNRTIAARVIDAPTAEPSAGSLRLMTGTSLGSVS
jgi:hypothetical protein